MNLLKIFFVILLRSFLKLFWLFPVRDRTVLFTSYNGIQYSDSPKYIFLALESDKSLKFVWVLDDATKLNYDGGADVRVVKPGSFSAIKSFVTSHVVISNDYISTYIPLRKRQLYINTWHGGGTFKKVGLGETVSSSYDKFFFKLHASMTSAFVSSSAYLTSALIEKSFDFHGTILKCGLPRNDVLFLAHHDSVIRKVRERYGIPEETGILLYAPTYRRNPQADSELWFHSCIQACEERFGKPFVCFYRSHHITGAVNIDSEAVNVTDYDDMQELLIASDILITDYSSSIWDYFLTGKPVFLFTPDVDYYRENRGFCLDISQWPCSYAKTNAALETIIRDFDEKAYAEKVREYLRFTGSYERGNAVPAVCDYIKKFLSQ